MNDNYISFKSFNLECCKIFGAVILAYVRKNNISISELSNVMLKHGRSYNYRSLYIGLTGFNSHIKDFNWFRLIFKELAIEIDSNTFAQTLQDSQSFNAEFKAKKQARKKKN